MSSAASTAGALHEAVLYSTPDELAERLAPRLRSSLDEDAPVVAVLDGPTRAEVRRVLGRDADRVEFPDPAAVHRLPPFTVAMRWARLDIGLNVAVIGLPISVLCAYRADDEVLARVQATHPRLTTVGGSISSGGYRPPVEALVEFPPPPPPDLGPAAAELAFGAPELGLLRHLVAEVAARGGTAPERVADLVLAVNEIGSNSVEHGPGHGRLRLWVTGEGVVAEVGDSGNAGLTFPGMVAPPPSGARGRGLWLASELCDVMQVWSDAHSTVIRLRMDHEPAS